MIDCQPSSNKACFAAGTLVHTKEGLVPIEQIKVGDWVLSKPESGVGEQAYKRVTQVFAHKPTRVTGMWYFPDEGRQSPERGVSPRKTILSGWLAKAGSRPRT